MHAIIYHAIILADRDQARELIVRTYVLAKPDTVLLEGFSHNGRMSLHSAGTAHLPQFPAIRATTKHTTTRLKPKVYDLAGVPSSPLWGNDLVELNRLAEQPQYLSSVIWIF